MIINPAMTGAFYGNLRVNAIGRDQGRPVAGAGNEFQDLSFTADINIDFGLTEGDWISGGLTVSRSMSVGVVDFQRQFAGISGAYHLAYGRKKDKVFTVGAKYGAYTTAFKTSGAGTDPFALQNNMETSADLQSLWGDVARMGEKSKNDFMVGLMLTMPAGKNADVRMGVAMDRILNPLIKSSNAVTDTTMMGTGGNNIVSQRFGRRINAHFSYFQSLNKKMVFNPNIVFQKLGSSTNLLVQGLFKYAFNPAKKMVLNFGLGVRFVNSTDIPVYLGLDYDTWRFGLAYDTNVSGLRPSNNTFGALELGIRKIFSWKKDPVVSPKFICPRL